MARPLRIQYPGAYYHITVRGNERRAIFSDESDRKLFLTKLFSSLNIYNVSLLSYICMTNHYYLLITTPEGNLSEFMQHFNVSYVSAYNRRHRRTGHLYEGRYKAFLVEADNYLLAVSRYIHLNPVRIRSVSKKAPEEKWKILMEWKWSSLGGYLSARKREKGVRYGVVLDYMGRDTREGRRAYKQFIQEGIVSKIENPLEVGKGHGIIGSENFVDWVKERFLGEDVAEREQPAARELKRGVKPQELIDRYVGLIGKRKGDVCRRGKKTIERSMLMELLYRFCSVTQPEIGRLVGGIDYSAVSQARKRLRIRMEKDTQVKNRYDKISEQLKEISRVKT